MPRGGARVVDIVQIYIWIFISPRRQTNKKNNTIQTKKKRAHLNSTVVQSNFKVHKVLLNAIHLVYDAFKLSMYMYTEKCCQTARDLLGRPSFTWIPYFLHSSDRSSTPNNLNIVLAGETTFKVNRKFKRMRSQRYCKGKKPV